MKELSLLWIPLVDIELHIFEMLKGNSSNCLCLC